MLPRINRRRMMADTSLAGAGVFLAGAANTRAATSPNEKLNLAIIGAGGRGTANLAEVAGENIVALCDVDGRRAAASFEKYSQARKYDDFRKMLDEMDGQIDAVVVSTPNHIHAPASGMAMRMGKHCYCEKPLTHSVFEARKVAQIAAEQNVATQMGTQIHASSNYRRVVELIQSGAIGSVGEVHIRLPGGGTAGDRPSETPAIPPELNWDLWIGPAPMRPYHPCYVPHDWHYWWDFGGGPLGNMGCHYLDLAFWALDLRYPTAIETEGPPAHPESTPLPLTVRWRFPRRNDSQNNVLPPVSLTWNHGRQRTAFWEEHGLPDWAWGVFVGSEGMLVANYSQHALLPDAKFADLQRPEPTIEESIGHHQEWIQACKTGSATTCNFDYSGAVTETILLGNVAHRHGDRIEWDAANMKITNAPEAERFLRREYRDGWTL